MLKSFVDDNQENWDLLLNELAFAYRTAVHKTTGETPFEMVYGRQPKLPLDLFYEEGNEDSEPMEPQEYAVDIKLRLRNMYDRVRQNIELNVAKSKIYYDRNVRKTEYVVGDKVWLLNSERKKGLSPKLSKSWKGPFEIIDVLGPVNYKIRMLNGKKRVIVHVNRLKKCFSFFNESTNESSSQQLDTTVVENEVRHEQQIQMEPEFVTQAKAADQLIQNENYETEDEEQEIKKRGRPRKGTVNKSSVIKRVQPPRKVKAKF